MKTLISALSAAFLVAGAASAQQPGAASGDQANRFELERTEHGVIRLDRRTGAMTLCRDENGTLACRMQPDERAAYDDELARLEKRVAALEERLGRAQPNAQIAPPNAGAPSNALPSDAEIDRSLSIMERFMRMFFGMVGEFEDRRKSEEPQPDRT